MLDSSIQYRIDLAAATSSSDPKSYDPTSVPSTIVDNFLLNERGITSPGVFVHHCNLKLGHRPTFSEYRCGATSFGQLPCCNDINWADPNHWRDSLMTYMPTTRNRLQVSLLGKFLGSAVLFGCCIQFWYALVHTGSVIPQGLLLSRESYGTTTSKTKNLPFHRPLNQIVHHNNNEEEEEGTAADDENEEKLSSRIQREGADYANHQDEDHPTVRVVDPKTVHPKQPGTVNEVVSTTEKVRNHNTVDTDIIINTTTVVKNEQRIREQPAEASPLKNNNVSSSRHQHPCANYDAFFHIQSGDQGAAAGTLFFQYMINQLIYADMHNLMPFIHLNNVTFNVYDENVHGVGDGLNLTILGDQLDVPLVWSQVTHQGYTGNWPGKPVAKKLPLQEKGVKTLWFRGTGVWNHYFEPVSEYDPNNVICQKLPYVELNYEHLNPAIQFYAPWAVRSWEYLFVPPNLLHNQSSPTGLHDWYGPQRSRAHDIVKKYFTVKPHLKQAAEALVPNGTNCLAVHIRHSDKSGKARRRIRHQDFLPYINAYLQNGGEQVYLATDSSSILERVQAEWSHVKLIAQSGIVRSAVFKPVFHQGSHDRTNREVLIEILAMSKCQFMIHGFSAVSESTHYMNPSLHNRSVDLEDPNHMNATEFGALVARIASERIRKKLE